MPVRPCFLMREDGGISRRHLDGPGLHGTEPIPRRQIVMRKRPPDRLLEPTPRYADLCRECVQAFDVSLGIFEMAPATAVAPRRCLDLHVVVRRQGIYYDHPPSPKTPTIKQNTDEAAISARTTAIPTCIR